MNLPTKYLTKKMHRTMLLNKLIILMGMLLVPFVSVYSQQNETIYRDQFEKIGLWAVVKLTEAHMLDFSEYIEENQSQLTQKAKNEKSDDEIYIAVNQFDNEKSESTLFSIIWKYLLFVLIGALVFLLVRIKLVASKKIDKINSVLREKENKYRKLKREYDNLEWQLLQVKMDKIQLNDQLENSHVTQQNSKNNEEYQNNEKDENNVDTLLNQTTVDTPKEIYLPFPYEDSKFYSGNQSNTPTKDSFYKVILDNTLVSGELFINPSDTLVRTAFNSHEMFLKSVCEYSNALESYHNNISTITPGKVKLEGDDWVVIEKIKIKFI